MVNISRIDLNLFVVLDAIYTEKGITRASERLNLSQPAISHALSRLRELVQDPLFVREGNAMVPTLVAQGLIRPVRRAIREIEGSLNQMNHFDPAVSTRQFTIGVGHIAESAMLPPLNARIRPVAPNVGLSSVRYARNTLASVFRAGELDAAIDVLLPNTGQLSCERLSGGAFVVAARAGHPVVNGHLDLETYLSLDHVVASSRKEGRAMEDAVLQQHGLERRVAVRCQHFWTACQVVASSDLVFTLPAHFAATANAALANQVVPFPIDAPVQDICLYWHPSTENDPGSRWLRTQIKDCFAANPCHDMQRRSERHGPWAVPAR